MVFSTTFAASAASLLLLAATGDAAPTAPTADACTTLSAQFKPGTGVYLDHKLVKDCLDLHPLDKPVRDATIDTLYKAIDGQYSFTDMASVASTIDGGKWDLKDVDLRAQLNAFRTKEFKNDREFHDSLFNLFNALGDAHTGYRSTCYHSIFSFQHPFVYTTLVGKDGKQFVKISNLLNARATAWHDKIKAAIGVETKSLLNYTITEIDGKDAVQWLKDFAQSVVGTSKDNQTRFNLATSNTFVDASGAIQTNIGGASSLGGKPIPAPSRKLTVVSPDGKDTKTIDVPFMASIGARGANLKFTDAQSYYQNACLAKPAASKAKRAELEMFTVDKAAKEFSALEVDSTTETIQAEGILADGFPKRINITYANYASFYMIDEETGVAAIPTYDSSDPADASCEKRIQDPLATAAIGTGGPAGAPFFCFIQEIHEGVSALKKAGAKRLILDYASNGGGWGDLGFFSIASMFKNVPRDDATFRITPLLRKLFTAAFTKDLNETTPLTMFGPANFVDTKTGLSLTSADLDRLVLNTNKQTFGQYTSEYSQFFSIVDGGAIADPKRPHNTWNATGIPFPTENLFEPKNVAILSTGYCGSTCAHAARLAVDHVGVRVFVKGGYAGAAPFSYTSFPGGNVVDIPQLFDDLKRIDLQDDELSPQPFKHNVALWRVNAGVGHSVPRDLPAEYDYAPAECRMDITEDTYTPPGGWKQAAEWLKSGCGNTPPTSSTVSGPSGTATPKPTYPVPTGSPAPTGTPVPTATSVPTGVPAPSSTRKCKPTSH
ncbi:hypothetical protein DFS34DRAFT_63273 [Phlyctochytrium arcticum]|nr:hypothetical protein DFS34DRAFT_63273 [Phlyctochytrium arcticum]